MKLASLALLAVLLVACKDKAPPPAHAVAAKPPGLGVATNDQPLRGFAGFSKDGTRFAWVTAAEKNDFLEISTEGVPQPDIVGVFPGNDGQKAANKLVVEFSRDRRPPPGDLALSGDLTASPPALRLVRGSASVAVPVGQLINPSAFAFDIWGVSADGKHAAVHVGGPDGGTDFHVFFVVAIP